MACVGRCEPFLFYFPLTVPISPLPRFDFPHAPRYGGGRSGRTITSGQRFAFLRAAPDGAFADYVCSRCFVGRVVLKI